MSQLPELVIWFVRFVMIMIHHCSVVAVGPKDVTSQHLLFADHILYTMWWIKLLVFMKTLRILDLLRCRCALNPHIMHVRSFCFFLPSYIRAFAPRRHPLLNSLFSPICDLSSPSSVFLLLRRLSFPPSSVSEN